MNHLNSLLKSCKMEVYIDKSNLKSFIEARRNPQYKDCYDDCCRMLKRQLHINYNFQKTKELFDDDFLSAYFALSNEGQGWSEDVDSYLSEMFPSRPIKSNVAIGFSKKSQYSSIFLIDDEKTKLLIDKGTFVVGTAGKEVETLNRLFCGKDYDFHKLYDIQSKASFPNWDQLSNDGLNLPLTDIIVMDRYLGGQISDRLTPYNIYKLLEVLVEHVKAEINVVFFCNKSFYNKELRTDITPDWDLFRKEVRDKVKKKTEVKCNVTIVFYSQSNSPHDRIIFTNYMLYRSGDSFEYFNSKGNAISKGKSFDVNSLAKKDNYDFAMTIIGDIQKLCDGLKSDMIIGDRKSNYLKF